MALRTALALAGWGIALATLAQGESSKSLEIDGGARVDYTLRTHSADAHVLHPGPALEPSSPLNTAKLLNLHLSAGDIESAALLSNAPRRRFEVLRDYRESVGEAEFKRVFAQYFQPQNRVLAEVAIDRHRLLVWDLREGATRIAGQYFVEVEGKYLVDDVPSDMRTRLRWVLEAYRNGKIPR